MALFIIYARNVPKGVAIPDSGVRKKYAIFFCLFLTFVFLTRDHEIWPEILIIYSMIVQIILCNCIFIIVSGARLTQIFHIYREKSTGHLAFISWLLFFIGGLSRLFTIFVEARNDYVYMFSIFNGVVLNGIIVSQFFIYSSKAPKKEVKDPKS
jgi:hypothetical protein